MSMMLKMMRNEGDRYETLSVGSGRKLVFILRKQFNVWVRIMIISITYAYIIGSE